SEARKAGRGNHRVPELRSPQGTQIRRRGGTRHPSFPALQLVSVCPSVSVRLLLLMAKERSTPFFFPWPRVEWGTGRNDTNGRTDTNGTAFTCSWILGPCWVCQRQPTISIPMIHAAMPRPIPTFIAAETARPTSAPQATRVAIAWSLCPYHSKAKAPTNDPM